MSASETFFGVSSKIFFCSSDKQWSIDNSSTVITIVNFDPAPNSPHTLSIYAATGIPILHTPVTSRLHRAGESIPDGSRLLCPHLLPPTQDSVAAPYPSLTKAFACIPVIFRLISTDLPCYGIRWLGCYIDWLRINPGRWSDQWTLGLDMAIPTDSVTTMGSGGTSFMISAFLSHKNSPGSFYVNYTKQILQHWDFAGTYSTTLWWLDIVPIGEQNCM